ncbi:hypothetical protein KJA13_00810 [Patescibacteria group bacterium]|nr:hypothetical protein [Patescibacteria group bacterium]
MKKEKKRRLVKFWTVRIWWALFIIAAGFFALLFRPYEVTKEIWLPEKYKIINDRDGEYIPFPKVIISGTASFMPPENFKKEFSDKENKVHIQADGKVYYCVKEGEEVFVAEVDHGKPLSRGGQRKVWVKSIINGSAIKLRCEFDFGAIAGSVLLWAIASGIVAGTVHR